MPDEMPDHQESEPQPEPQFLQDSLNFKKLCSEFIEKAKAERPEHLELSAEGSSREDAVQSGIAKHMPENPDAEMTRAEYEELAEKIEAQVQRDEARALRSQARHKVIGAMNAEELARVAQDPSALRVVIGRQAIAIIKAALPRDANLHRVFDIVIPRDGKPATIHWRETRFIALVSNLEIDEVTRHKETIIRVARRVISAKEYFSD